jgi:hypothetical protein
MVVLKKSRTRSSGFAATRPASSPVNRFPLKTKEVVFEPVEGPLNDRIDEAYRVKYRSSPYLGAMIGVQARGATVKVVPRIPSADRKEQGKS